MSSSSSWILVLLAALAAAPGYAQTKRMQDVAKLLGLDASKDSAAAKEAEAAMARLVKRGMDSHPALKIREAELQASRARVDAAQGHYQPTLSVNASARQEQRQDLNNEEKSQADGHSMSLVLRENLWRGGQDAGQVDLARQDATLAEIRKFHESEGLTFRVTEAALDYNFRYFRQLIDAASLADAEELRALAERKFQAGQVGKIDIHLAGMRESAARSSAARASIERQQAYHKLLNVLGPQESPEGLKQDIEALTQAALPLPEALPELKPVPGPTLMEKSSIAQQKRAEITLDQNYRRRFMPQIDLVGTLGRDQNRSWLLDDADQKALSKANGTSLQLEFSWNLWDRSQDHLIRAAAAEKNAAHREVEVARHEVNMETERLRNLIAELHQSLGYSRAAYQQAGQLYDAQRRLYETGVIGLQPLMDAEREKREAIGNWQQSMHELQLSLLHWQALERGYLASGSIREG
ncbi:TolC family protein [Oligoflexus tunisiensis]|uniref:TolC family protein n=1 Tax=Oligoflexus tunisiensis TaxID=708132 RepID=UPI00159EFF48|nr:TolC family protein [Oligoflexus tunisiensis]